MDSSLCNDDELQLIDAVKTSQKEIDFRKKSVKNMWVIIITIFVVVTYNTLYSLILFIWADTSCFI